MPNILPSAGQFKAATSPDLTLNGDLYREQYKNGLNLGIEIILNYPAFGWLGMII